MAAVTSCWRRCTKHLSTGVEQFAHSVILHLVEQIVEIVHTPQCSQQGTVVKIADLLVVQVVKETFDDTKCFRWTEFGFYCVAPLLRSWSRSSSCTLLKKVADHNRKTMGVPMLQIKGHIVDVVKSLLRNEVATFRGGDRVDVPDLHVVEIVETIQLVHEGKHSKTIR